MAGQFIEGLWVTPGWKRLSILDTGGCINDTTVNSIIERLDDMRSENPAFVHSFDDKYRIALPGVSLARNGNEIAKIVSPRPLPELPPPCTMLSLRDLMPSWLDGARAEPVIVIERENYGFATEKAPFTDSSISIWYKDGQSQWRELRNLKRISESEQWYGDKTGASLHTSCQMGRQCHNLFECRRLHTSPVRFVV